MPVITLLTDFGTDDEYVGVMKGVILSIYPSVSIVDITHQIGPQDITRAAYTIQSAYRYFPDGTVHLIVVDPGVGSQRDVIAARHKGHVFVAPDNGIISLLLNEQKSDTIISICNSTFFLKPISATFHGRDIFAPVGAHIAKGIGLEKLGRKKDFKDIVHLADLGPRISENGDIVGKIVSIDRFGNLITNIDLNQLSAYCPIEGKRSLRVRVGAHVIFGLSETYENVELKAPLALIGSRGYLEIAVNRGNAKQYFNAHRGDIVRVVFE